MIIETRQKGLLAEEAWGEVLGLPGSAAELQRQAEIAQLDLAWQAEAVLAQRDGA